LQVAENVFNSQVARWNNTACGGGLKWQIFPANPGYNYKNSVSNGAFFHLAARLARYTGNQTYVDWASKAWDWMEAVGFIDAQFNVFDGAETATNCTNIDQVKWTYNNGLLLYGSAVLSNYTNGSSLWTDRSTSMLQAALQFFTPFPNATYILYEPACESVGTCDADQYSFKGFLARWMGPTMQMMASTTDAVMTLLKASAAGAAQSCSGGELQTTCGERWYIDGFDNSAGVGQELSALEVVQALLVRSAPAPIVSSVVHIQIEVSSTMSATKTTASTMATVPSFTTHLAPASSSSAATTSADGAFGLLASILRGLVYSTAVAFAGRAFV
jgi:mannan endo-1,6-alpha-mannosidase